MAEPDGARTDEKMEQVMSRILLLGVATAAVIVALGGAYYLVRYGGQVPRYGLFVGEPAPLRSLSGIVSAAVSLHSRGIIQLGLLLLIATPIARVTFSVAAFARQKDYLYVVVTAIVLAVLAYNLLVGR